jgi:Tfp pilus assembly protein PilX
MDPHDWRRGEDEFDRIERRAWKFMILVALVWLIVIGIVGWAVVRLILHFT